MANEHGKKIRRREPSGGWRLNGNQSARSIFLCALLALWGVGWSASSDLIAADATAANQAFCGRPTLPVGEDPPRFRVRLGIDRKATSPGGKLRIRVENLGTESVAYGYLYRLARYKQGSWIHQPTGPVFGSRLYAQAGRAGKCEEIGMASDAVPGTYRISKEVWPAAYGQSKAITVRTTFQVR